MCRHDERPTEIRPRRPRVQPSSADGMPKLEAASWHSGAVAATRQSAAGHGRGSPSRVQQDASSVDPRPATKASVLDSCWEMQLQRGLHESEQHRHTRHVLRRLQTADSRQSVASWRASRPGNWALAVRLRGQCQRGVAEFFWRQRGYRPGLTDGTLRFMRGLPAPGG